MNLFRDLSLALLPPVIVLVLQMIRVTALPDAVGFDVLAHFLGGVAIAWSATILWMRARVRKWIPTRVPLWISAWCVLGAVMLAGIAWELFEFFMQISTDWLFQLSVADTLSDLVMDTCGGLVFSIITWKKRA